MNRRGSRVLFLLNSLGEGSGPLLRARYLAYRGYTVEAVAFLGIGPSRVSDQLSENLRSIRERYRHPGLSIRSLSARGFWDVRGWLKLVHLLLRGRFDACFAHHNHMSTAGVILARLLGIPEVVKVELGSKARRGRLGYFFDRIALETCDEVVCISEATLDSFSRRELERFRPKMRVIHNGVSVRDVVAARDRDGFRRRHGIPAGAVVIATAGRLHAVKNHDLMLSGFRSLSERPVGDILLAIAGRGPRLEELRRKCVELGIEGRVLFLGHLPREEVFALLSAADIFTMTSHTEGFSESLVQAMAAGLPSVLTDIPSFREAVRHEEEGLIVPDGHPDSLADAFEALVRDREMRGRLGRNAQRRAESEFSIEGIVDRYERLLSVE